MALKGFSHIGICVRDLDVSTRFYIEVLGFEVMFTVAFDGEFAATMERAGMFTSRMMRRDDLRIELLWWPDDQATGDGVRRPMNATGLTHLAFRVDTIDELYDIARRAGGQAWPETLTTVPGHGVGGGDLQNVYVTDPDGTRIECMAGTPDLAAM
ncbi:VOC family protein [Nocardia alni]|uniref:VOC family protein n=1 Tax=Nocardia alni TaxID=2815723 RepID=UPI001C245872|nr:VOC family protein [Nocardia alni]